MEFTENLEKTHLFFLENSLTLVYIKKIMSPKPLGMNYAE